MQQNDNFFFEMLKHLLKNRCLLIYTNKRSFATYIYMGMTWFRQVEESMDCSGVIDLIDQMPINGNYNYALAY